MHHCARQTVPMTARTRPLVRRVPGHRSDDQFTTRFPGLGSSRAGPVPPGTGPDPSRSCTR
jgi:hypothetical protein